MQKIDTQKIIVLSISFALALTIVYSGFIHALVAFFLVGAIPGTNLSIPPTIMLATFAAIGWLLFFRASLSRLVNSSIRKRRELQKSNRKRHLPKRRYSRV